MLMRIGITGTPGSGKSTLAKELAKKLKGNVLEINDVLEETKAFRLDKNTNEKVAKLAKLQKEIIRRLKNTKNTTIVVGHLLQEMHLPLDMVIVKRINLNTLFLRLKSRGYPKWKISENIIAEGMDYCGEKAAKVYGNTYEIESEKEKKAIIEGIGNMHMGKKISLNSLRKQKDKTKEMLSFISRNKKLGI
ncbi:MAG: AAA family ATPase [Candidatus Micrarchaeaceae archaeon]